MTSSSTCRVGPAFSLGECRFRTITLQPTERFQFGSRSGPPCGASNSIVKQGTRIEKPPKAGDGRLLSLDLLTGELFRERFRRRRAEGRSLDSATKRR
jgi:hypothetical protein